MPSNKDTKKKLPEILDKFASNSEKATKQLGEMSSQLSAFVDMLSENVQKESRRKDTEDRRREKARAVRAQRDAEREVEIAAGKAEREVEKKKKKEKKDADDATAAASAAATELQQARNEYAEAVKGLAQLDKNQIQNARQKEIAGLKEKGTPYSDIADKNFESGDILGGLFASIFARKESPDKKRLADLQKQEKDYTEQEEARTKEDTRTQAKKKLQESVTKLQGSEKPAAVSPSKITNPEDQIVAETIKLNDEDKLEQSQEQTKRLGTLDENISRIWTDHLQVSIVDISDPAIDKLKKAIGGGAPAAGAGLGDILSSFGKLAKIGTWISEFGAVLASPAVLGIGASLAAVAALIYGFRKNQEDLAKDLQEIQKQRDKDLQDLTEKNAKEKLHAETQRQISEKNKLFQPSNTGYYQPQIPGRAEEAARVQIDRKFQDQAREKYKTIQNVPTEVLQQYVSSDKAKVAAFDKAGMFGKKDISNVEYNIAKSKLSANESELKKRIATTAPTPAATTTAPTPAATTTAPTPATTTAPTPTPKSSSEEISKILKTGDGFNTVEMSDGTVQTRKGDRNWRNNNPGNIEWGPFAKSKGAIGTDGRFAIFPTYVMGRQAKSDLLFEGKNYKDLNIKQAISRYAPPTNNKGKFENDTPAYIKAVTSAVGGTENTNLRDLTSDQRVQFLTAVQKQEGFRQGNIITESPSTPQLLTSTPQTGVNVVAAMKNKAETERGNTVTIAPITTNNVIAGAKSGDGLPYRDARDYINKAINPDVFGIVTRSSAG